MRIGSLFSGYGGLDIACEAFFGATTAWHCDIDSAASKVLAHHWPEVSNLGDITAVDWAAAEPVDIITGGFPCQDVSAAGRRAGIADGTRSGLWAHMLRAVTEIRPRYVVIENVRGLLSARAHRPMEPTADALGNAGGQPLLRALGAVLGDLSDIGYDAQWTTVAAAEVGACHRRERVFVLATPADSTSTGLDRGAGPDSEQDSRGQRSSGSDADRRGNAPTNRPPAADAGRAPVGQQPASASPEKARANSGHRSGDSGGERTTGDRRGNSDRLTLLPTPSTADAVGGARSAEGMTRGHQKLLQDVVVHWGPYEAAIERAGKLYGTAAPSPTEPNRIGNPRLSAAFAEWMMLLTTGWVTDPAIGLTRNEQLKAIGNGVVPPQAFEALCRLWPMQWAVAA